MYIIKIPDSNSNYIYVLLNGWVTPISRSEVSLVKIGSAETTRQASYDPGIVFAFAGWCFLRQWNEKADRW